MPKAKPTAKQRPIAGKPSKPKKARIYKRVPPPPGLLLDLLLLVTQVDVDDIDAERTLAYNAFDDQDVIEFANELEAYAPKIKLCLDDLDAEKATVLDLFAAAQDAATKAGVVISQSPW